MCVVDEISSQVYQIQSFFPWPFRQLFIPEVKKDKVQRKDNFLLGKLNSKDWSHHHITRAEDYKHLNPAYMYNFDKILLNCQKDFKPTYKSMLRVLLVSFYYS